MKKIFWITSLAIMILIALLYLWFFADFSDKTGIEGRLAPPSLNSPSLSQDFGEPPSQLSGLASESAPTVQANFQQLFAFFQSGNLNQFEKHFEGLKPELKTDRRFLALRADFLYYEEEYEKALEASQELLAKQPDHTPTQYRVAELFTILEDYEAGRNILGSMIDREPHRLSTIKLLFESYRLEGREQEGIAALEEIRRRHPESEAAVIAYAQSLEESQARVEVLEDAYQKNQRSADIARSLAKEYFRARDFERSSQIALESIRLDESSDRQSIAKDLYIQSQIHLENYEQALAYVQTELQASPSNSMLLERKKDIEAFLRMKQ